jgi:hypothetical protein
VDESAPVAPNPCTTACAAYFRASDEIENFFGFVIVAAKGMDERMREFAQNLVEIPGLAEDKRTEYERTLREGSVYARRMEDYRPLVTQLFLTRSVDNFLTYVSDLISLIFSSKPETFRPPDQVGWEEINRYRGGAVDDLIASFVDKKVADLSYGGLTEIARYLKSTLGFDVFPKADELNQARTIIEKRNLIVHRRGVVDRHFLDRIPNSGAILGELLDVTDVLDSIHFLGRSVLAIEARAVGQFGLPQI